MLKKVCGSFMRMVYNKQNINEINESKIDSGTLTAKYKLHQFSRNN